MNNQKNIPAIIVAAVIFLSLCLAFFLIARDLVWSGKLIVSTDFKEFTPYFSILKPQGLINIDSTPEVLDDPVYFDLSLPRDFQKADLEIEYKDDFKYKIKIGPNIGADWELKPLDNSSSADDGYKISSLVYDMAGKNINKGKLRFMISIPGLSADKPVFIRRVKITLERAPLLQEGLYNNLLNYYNYAKVQFAR
ncbi:MAG: hypothetical protein PHC97_02565 [Patescibacteria group bacterium]|nr:hypothetical protein [Patescibacteria group bacterium]